VTARVLSYDLQKAKLRRSNKGADGKTDQERDCLRRSQASILAFEAGLARSLDLAGNGDDPSREVCALEGAFTRDSLEFLNRLEEARRGNASLFVSACAAATAMACLILKHSADLLHRASLLSSNSLAGRDAQCLSTTTRTSVKRTTETFGDGAA
jgi:hypothetical protein